MKKKYLFLIFISLRLIGIKANAQNVDDFESAPLNSTTFTNNLQSFTIASNTVGDSFKISTYPNSGWNGHSIDQKFIDNTVVDSDNDGTSFIISTTDGVDITIKSLYFFLSTSSITNTKSSTLTIEGKKDGTTSYVITKKSGFSNAETFSPNNGYTFIDFSIESGSDYSNTLIDELIFTTTNDGDYISLDAFTWNNEPLTINDFDGSKTVKLFPNPTSEQFELAGLSKTENYVIYNTMGSKIKSGKIFINKKTNVKDLKSGSYFLKFEHGGAIKFIKE
jgi:hypothetical protein